MSTPITVAIERTVDPARSRYASSWVRQGLDLAATYRGFLGGGWVQSQSGSDRWTMLYRFASHADLRRWEASEDRRQWVAAGADFANETRVERRTGIEGWFDAPQGTPVDTPAAPPRWKQGSVIWMGFFPLNLAFTFLLGLVPGFLDLWLPARVLISTLLLTPLMVYLVLPALTRAMSPWLNAPRPRPQDPTATEAA